MEPATKRILVAYSRNACGDFMPIDVEYSNTTTKGRHSLVTLNVPENARNINSLFELDIFFIFFPREKEELT